MSRQTHYPFDPGHEPEKQGTDVVTDPADAEARVLSEVATECRRQVTTHGYTAEHDDLHLEGELAQAAGAYVAYVNEYRFSDPGVYAALAAPAGWPWEASAWKPRYPRRDLIRAIALLVKEVQRMDREQERMLLTTQLEQAPLVTPLLNPDHSDPMVLNVGNYSLAYPDSSLNCNWKATIEQRNFTVPMLAIDPAHLSATYLNAPSLDTLPEDGSFRLISQGFHPKPAARDYAAYAVQERGPDGSLSEKAKAATRSEAEAQIMPLAYTALRILGLTDKQCYEIVRGDQSHGYTFHAFADRHTGAVYAPDGTQLYYWHVRSLSTQPGV